MVLICLKFVHYPEGTEVNHKTLIIAGGYDCNEYTVMRQKLLPF
jgi:hypothetical protein